MKEKFLHLDQILPYQNNPRDNRSAIEPVAESIRRYGYITPIVVDKKNVIVAGHTRLLALKQLGWTEPVLVIVTSMDEEKCREFRIIDNKTGEMADWDKDRLIAELRSFEADMEPFFKGKELSTLLKDVARQTNSPDQKHITRREEELQGHFTKLAKAMHDRIVEVRCRGCGETFGFDLA